MIEGTVIMAMTKAGGGDHGGEAKKVPSHPRLRLDDLDGTTD